MLSHSLLSAYFVWVVLISIVTFFAYAWDKRSAQTQRQRVPEARLHLLSLMGGWPGALLGRKLFRHKTQKIWFTLITFAIVGVHGLLIAVLFCLN